MASKIMRIICLTQVQTGCTQIKRYLGSLTTEEEAAQLYDRIAIIQNGMRAKTNFSYTKEELLKILEDHEKSKQEELITNE